MSQATGNTGYESDMFSDHPSDAKRIAAIKQELPEALTYYNPPKTTVKSTTATKKKTVRKTTTRRK